ncbi:MAG: hypothetical protein ACD_2C00208G0011 [uncultured bacterium (gcode 4)]|uniref:Lipoprotein n=1 Tax=uncultured bacterium (gcode 4) TaxID=1234023 RepID=K2H0B9_9BACT|nr:MAG: hypothetical protein ACD_2C00208G0011 [uncultured bacterium (gcode 4)]
MRKDIIIKLTIIPLLIFTSCWRTTDVNLKKENNWTQWITQETKKTTNTDWTFSEWKQEIIKLMLKSWPDSILNADCSKYDPEGKDYCEKEKLKIESLKKEITWESVFIKWNTYISIFDCNQIKQAQWKKYCEDYKVTLWNQAPTAVKSDPEMDKRIEKVLLESQITENLNCATKTDKEDKLACEEKNNVIEVIKVLEQTERSQRKNYDCSKFVKEEIIATCKKYISTIN